MMSPDRLSAARHFHIEVAELLARIAPSSATVTCIGIASTRAYSYFWSVAGATEPPAPIWTARLQDVLPIELVLDGPAHVLSSRVFGPRFTTLDSDSRIAVLALASGGAVHGIVGLERAAGEPELSACELAELGALSGALSIAASYALMVELLAYEEAVLRVGASGSTFVALVDRSARQVIWAGSPQRALAWHREGTVERLLFEPGDSIAATTKETHEVDVGGVGYSVLCVRCVPDKTEVPLSRREREVAQLLVGGYANLNVAAHLGISENTIRTYIRRLYKKLNVCNRIDLVRAYEATI